MATRRSGYLGVSIVALPTSHPQGRKPKPFSSLYVFITNLVGLQPLAERPMPFRWVEVRRKLEIEFVGGAPGQGDSAKPSRNVDGDFHELMNNNFLSNWGKDLSTNYSILIHSALRRPHMSTNLRIHSLKVMEMDRTKLFTLFVCVSLFWFSILYRAKCEIYTVGDDEQWSTGVNYNAWSSKYDFAINDTLVFKYIEGVHNVYEVTENTYRSCNGSSGVLAKYSSGKDEIKLTEAKEYWFICDIAGHCLGGMRFTVNLTQASSAVPSTSTGNDRTRSPSSYDSSAIKPVPVYIYIFVVGIFACLYY